MYVELAVLALFVFCYSLVAGRLERAAASGPIVFVVAGVLMGPLWRGWFDGLDSERGRRQMRPDQKVPIARQNSSVQKMTEISIVV